MAHPDRLVELLRQAKFEATYQLGEAHTITNEIEALIRHVVMDQAQYVSNADEMTAALLGGTEEHAQG